MRVGVTRDCLKDTQRRYLITNQANAAACGHTVEEIIGKSDLELWPSELAQRHLADDMEVMISRHRKTVEEPIENANDVIWMETHRAPVLDAGLYWPGLARPSLEDLQAQWTPGAPVAALTFYRALVTSGATEVIDAHIAAL